MKQVEVLPFELIFCQDVATSSGNPLECLPASKTEKKTGKMRRMPLGPPGALGPLWASVWSLNIFPRRYAALWGIKSQGS